jgi:uroporphyrinogen decarboxylase
MENSMTSRQRVMAALNFQETDRVPIDLGGFLCTGINAFAYPGLIKSLGLPPRLPRVYLNIA